MGRADTRPFPPLSEGKMPNKLTIEIVRNKFKNELVDGQVYVNAHEKLLWKCLKGHKNYLQNYNNHCQGQKCPRCSGREHITIERINEEFPDELVLNQIFKGNHSKLKWLCINDTSHGVYRQAYSNHSKGEGCPKCYHLTRGLSQKFNFKKILDEFPLDLVKNQKYINARTKMLWRCLINPHHGNYWQTYDHHRQGKRCPKCLESSGEKRIYNHLKNRKIQFIRNCRSLGCLYKGPLEFDFVIKKNRVLIEYQGNQHYFPIKHWGGKKVLADTQKRDKIKLNWARRNGWRLIRISYRIKNIEAYLDKRLSAKQSRTPSRGT